MVRVIETLSAEGKAANSLSVTVAVGENENSMAEFARVKDALLTWQRSGHSARGGLEIDIQSEEAVCTATLQEFMNVVSERDPEMGEFYRNLKEAKIYVVSPAGRIIKTVGFAH
jgi:hypothetical protein